MTAWNPNEEALAAMAAGGPLPRGVSLAEALANLAHECLYWRRLPQRQRSVELALLRFRVPLVLFDSPLTERISAQLLDGEAAHMVFALTLDDALDQLWRQSDPSAPQT